MFKGDVQKSEFSRAYFRINALHMCWCNYFFFNLFFPIFLIPVTEKNAMTYLMIYSTRNYKQR